MHRLRISPSRVRSSRIHSTSSKAIQGLSWPIAVPTGIVAGSISALAGVGGGVIIIPIIARFSTLPQKIINATSIFTVTTGAGVGATNFLISDSCNLPVAMILAGSSIFTTGYGVRLAQRLANQTLTRMVSVAMLAMVPIILSKQTSVAVAIAETPVDSQISFATRIQQQVDEMEKDIAERPVSPTIETLLGPHGAVKAYQTIEYTLPYVFAGVASGFLSGLLGLGGGLLMTSYLSAATEMPQTQVVGTSLLAIVPIGMSACYHNFRLGLIHYPTAVAIGSGLCLSVWLTSKYVTFQVPEERLRQVFAGTLTLSSIAMLRRTL